MAPRLETILARQLRRDMTGVERRLWAHLCLRQLDGYKFRRQSPIGPYIVDFLCVSERLVVEVDRPTHDDRLDADAFRDAWLRAVGYRVLRFPSEDVTEDVEGVVEDIRLVLLGARPLPTLPQRGGG